VPLDYAARFGWDVGAGKAEKPGVKCLAERPEKRTGRSQAPNGSVTRLRSSKPERARAEQSERKGNRVRSRHGARGGSGARSTRRWRCCLLANLMNQMAADEKAKEDKSRKHEDDLKPFLPGHAGVHVAA
jgi:hypothetical protein